MLEDQNWASKTITNHYGGSGLKVYKLIDGKRSILEISNRVGIGQQKVVEIIKFMETEGIIKLDYGEKKVSPGSLSSLPLNLPQDIYVRMQQHSEINWNDVMGRLLSVYLSNIEHAEKSLLSKSFSGSVTLPKKKTVKSSAEKKVSKAKPVKAKKKTSSKAKGRANTKKAKKTKL